MAPDPARKVLFVAVATSVVFAGCVVSQAVAGSPIFRPSTVATSEVSIAAPLVSDPEGVHAKPEITSQSMPFRQCLQVIERTASQLGVAPTNIVESDVLRVVQFCADGASVIVSCSRRHKKLVLTKSPDWPGCN